MKLNWEEPEEGFDGPFSAKLPFGSMIFINVDYAVGGFGWAIFNSDGESVENMFDVGFKSFDDCKESAEKFVAKEIEKFL